MLKPTGRAETPSDLGDRLRHQRKARGLTMQQVADAAGLSVGFISQVERGIAVPSLASLSAIAGAIELPMPSLFDRPAKPVTRSSDRVARTLAAGTLAYERLSTVFPGSQLHAVIVHEPPGHRRDPIGHAGEELFFVLQGALTIEIEGRRHVLRQGDTIHFDATRKHATWNHTGEPVVLLWTGTVDVFGTGKPNPTHAEI